MLVPNKVLTKDEGEQNPRHVPKSNRFLTCLAGGRYTPFMSNYRPQLFIRTADITVALSFPEGTPDAAEKMVSICHYSVCVNDQPRS